MSSRFILGVTADTLILAAGLTATAVACPPSLTVSPAGGAAGVFLVVHAIQGCHPGPLTVTGTAEGLVGGERRSLTLTLEPGTAPDDYQVRRQWPREGVWVLRLTVSESGDHATALVGVAASGRIATVREPSRRGTNRPVSDADVAAMLRSLAAG
jgi:hypothetical protein